MKTMKSTSPRYRCCACKTIFTADGPGAVGCPICKSIYVEWMNYKDFRAED
jgi:rRNA maturation endonuclease Nob1